MSTIPNLYRTGLTDELFTRATIHSDWAVFRTIRESDLNQNTNQIILTGASAENGLGVLFYQLLNCGENFKAIWGDRGVFLIQFLAGDVIQDHVFVRHEDVLMRWGDFD